MRSSRRFSRRLSSSSTADFGVLSFIAANIERGITQCKVCNNHPRTAPAVLFLHMMSDIRFRDFEDVLAAAGSMADAAEAHGSLCGALCSMSPYKMQDWVNEILPDGASLSDE